MKNGMIESTYTDDKTKKYYAWRASNYDALAEWEKEFHRAPRPHNFYERIIGLLWGQEVVLAHKAAKPI